MIPANPLFVALDTADHVRAMRLAASARNLAGGIKLGLEYFSAHGPDGAAAVAASSGDLPLFLDLKFHDIPNTVAGAVRAACRMAPFFMTLHAAGGVDMMRSAVDAARSEASRLGIPRPRLLAITVLTSMNAADLESVGMDPDPRRQVQRLALQARDCGMDGIVCSALEAALVRTVCGPDFVIVVPGIRPLWSSPGDQKRVVAPADALAAGADYLVVGRPLAEEGDVPLAIRRLVDEMAASMPCLVGDSV